MAAPDNVTTLNLSGKFVQNRSLSDNFEKGLTWQGVGWVTRKFIHNTTITVHIKHDKDDEGVEHVDFEPILPGGLAGPLDHMALDWTSRKIEQKPFGFVITKIRRIPITDVTDEYLNSGWLPDVSRDGVIERHVEPDKERNSYSWKSHTVWGFEDINGERRQTIRIRYTGPNGEDFTARLVYDYVGPI